MTVHVRAVPTSMKALMAVLFAALILLGLPAPAAHASAFVDVTLNVATKAGTALPGLNVFAYPVKNHAIVGDYIAATWISGSKYVFTEQPGDPVPPAEDDHLHPLDSAQTYAFFFDAPASATTAFDQFWGGTTFVEESRSWSYGTDGRDLSVTLATNSTFTGKVTGLSSKVLAGVTVFPWRWDGNEWYRNDNAKATTTSTGVYTMRNLEPGTYRLEFSPNNTSGYLSEFSGNTTVFGSAAALTLGLGSTVSYNAALVVGGTITGRVQLTDQGLGGNVLSYGITARAYPYDSSTGKVDTSVSYPSRETLDDGKWTISGLPTGQYKVKTYDTYGDGLPSYVDMWLVGQEHVGTATVYSVVAGKTTSTLTSVMPYAEDRPTTSLDLNIYAGTADNDHRIGDDTEVTIVSNDGEDFAQHFLLEGGTTHFPFVPTGEYTIYVDPHDGVRAPYIGTKTIASGSANIWNIVLPTKSSYTYSTPATIAQTATAAGTTYVVNPGHTSFSDDKVTFSYIWLRGDAPIYGSQSETSSSYTSRGVDVNQKISVIVRADSFGYPPVFTTVVAANPVTTGAAPTALTMPVVTGTLAPLSLLTATAGSWDMTGLLYSYQWKRNDAPIAAATARTYVLQPADADAIITVSVTATKPGYGVASIDSSPQYVTKLVAPKVTKASTFKTAAIAGGVRVTATPGTWSPAPTSYTYTWKVGGSTQAATGPVLECSLNGMPSCANAGLAIEVTVTAHRLGYVDGSRSYLVRKGTQLPGTAPGPMGYVYDYTDGGHPSLDEPTDPAYVTHTLRASDPVYSYPGGNAGVQTRSYLWQRKTGTKWASISKATKVTYIPTTADSGHELRVRIITTSSLYPTMTQYFTAGTGRLLPVLTGTPATVQIGGTDDIGTVKWASVSVWPVSGVAQAYQWYSCNPASVSGCSDTPATNADWKAISKATLSTYTPAVALSGQNLMVRVVGSKSGYLSAVAYSPARQFAGSDNAGYTATGAATISAGLVGGTAAVGRQLMGKAGAVDRTTGVTRAYQWKVCDGPSGACTDVPAATGITAVPTNAWLTYGDTWVQFTETVSYNGVVQFTGQSARYDLGPGTNVAVSVPRISVSGTTYTLIDGWTPDSTATYQWFDGATPIGTGSSVSADPGTTPVYVSIHVIRPGYQTIDLKVAARKGTFPATTITGGTTWGSTLNGTATSALGLPVTAKYQWYSGTAAIKGKTASTFVPTTSYIGRALKVRVTVSSSFYNTITYYTPAIVLGYHPAASGTPAILTPAAGSKPGSKLSVDLTSFPGGLSYTYSWQRSTDGGTVWTAAATTSTYTLLASDVNKLVRVVVVAKKSGWLNSASTPSAPVTVGYSPALALTAPFILVGTGKVDGALTASTAWNTTGYALTYSWTRNGVTIPGATGTSVTPTASWIGDEVQAHVTATKAGYQSVTVVSNEVKVAAAAAPTSGAITIARSGNALTASSGVWNVAGVTITYAWYDESTDPAHTGTALSTSATYTPSGSGTFTVVVTAKRAGYENGSVSKGVAFTPTP